MSKFWSVVTVLFITAIALLVVDRAEEPRVTFSDLETECRYDTGNSTDIGLEGRQITFSGRFTVSSPNANLDYSYQVTDSNSIRLNVIASDSVIPDMFVDNCLGSVIYDAKTERLEQGNYTVTLAHNGERQERVGIRVK